MDTEKLIAAARACVGTPFHHQGRAARAGLDCIGLIVHAAREGGLAVEDETDYGRRPEGTRLAEGLLRHGFRRVENIMPGDVLLFRVKRLPRHVALAVTATRMVHAYAPAGRVVETEIGETWMQKLAGVYRFTGPSNTNIPA